MDDQYAKYRLWEYDYQTIAGKLVCEFGLRGEKAIHVIKGGWVWEAYPKRFRQTFLKRLRDLGVSFEIVIVQKKMSVFMLGTDRIKLAAAIKKEAKARRITREQKIDYLLRLGKGEFPNDADDYEVALEFETLV